MYSINANILPDKISNMFVSNSNIHNYLTRQRHHYRPTKLTFNIWFKLFNLQWYKEMEQFAKLYKVQPQH